MGYRVGVESAHSFGDLLFNVPLIRAIGQLHNTLPYVAVRPQYQDAFYNIPWIADIIHINDMGEGTRALKNAGCSTIYQITQNVKFLEYRQSHPEHSLIDTPLWVGKEIGVPDFDQKPIFLPTENELWNTRGIIQDIPTIAIESVAKSGQSWADQLAIDMILDKYLPTHRVLWLSNQGAPNHQNVNNLLNFTRREVIMCLRAADIFFSVGSGFFCASQALPVEHQPKKIVCMWKDEFYKYERRLGELRFHNDISWVHNHGELHRWLTTA